MKILVSLSGGLDSSTLLGYYVSTGAKVTAVSFAYGSKHNKYENYAAQQVAGFYKVELIQLDISQAMAGIKSSLMKSGGPIPEGHYQEESMKQTVVPGRNMIFSSILAGMAESRGIEFIGLGVHAGDHVIYPDCRPEFIRLMSRTIIAATDQKVHGVLAPFILMNKANIVKLGLSCLNNPVPYNLTRTCYKDQEAACGVCGSCQERLGAFKINNTHDPIIYERTI